MLFQFLKLLCPIFKASSIKKGMFMVVVVGLTKQYFLCDKQINILIIINMIVVVGIILIFLITVSCYVFYIKPERLKRRYKKILEELGYKVYTYPYGLKPPAFEDEKRNVEKHGDAQYTRKHILVNYDIALYNILGKVGFSIINIELMREIMSAEKMETYPKYNLIFKGVTSLVGEGTIFSEGANWRRKRKIVAKLFSYDLVLSNITNISYFCDRFMEQMEEKSKVGEGEYKFSVKELGMGIFSSVILKCFMGIDQNYVKIKDERLPIFLIALINSLATADITIPVLLFGKLAYKYPLTKQLKKINQGFNLYQNACLEIIKEKKQSFQKQLKEKGDKLPQPKNILESLMIENHKSKGQSSQTNTYTDYELISEFSNFVLAGTETTSATLQMVMIHLGQNPEVEKKARKLINEVIKSNQDITNENLKKLPYLEWIINQTIRLNGPFHSINPRIATADNLLKDIPVSKGTMISFSSFSNHYNPKYFKDPENFRPERWEEECKDLPREVLLDFGEGPRSCLGKRLALIQAQIALIKMLQRYKQIRLPKQKRIMKRIFIYEPVYPTNLVTFVK